MTGSDRFCLTVTISILLILFRAKVRFLIILCFFTDKTFYMYHIRESKLSDAETIISFQMAMAKETENRDLDLDIVSKGVQAALADNKKGRYIIAESSGKTVASLMLTQEWSDWRNSTIIWIQSVYVIPECRGKGAYKAMYGYVQKMVLADEKYIGIRLYVDKRNINAQKIYSALGMDGNHYTTFEWMKH